MKILWTTYQFKREQIYNSHINSYINSYSDATHVSNSYSKALHFSTALWGYLCNKTSHTITMTLSFWVLLSPWCFIPWLPISKFEAILLATSVSHQNTQWRVVQVSLVFPCFPKMFWSFDTSSSPRKPGPQHSQVRAPWPLWRYWSSQTQVAPGWKETHAMLRWNQALQTNLSKTSCHLGTLLLDTSWYTVSVLLLVLVRLRNGSALRRRFFGPKKWSLFHLQVKVAVDHSRHQCITIDHSRLQMLKKPAENLRCTYCIWLPQSNNQLNNHPLAPEVSGSTCKPVDLFFYRAKKEAFKKNHSAQPPKIFQRSVENPMDKLRLNSIFTIRGTTPCCHSASRMRATLRASAIPRSWRCQISEALNIWWCHLCGDATHALQMEMNRWRWNIFQITGDLKISICLVLPLIPPTHKGFTYILCNQRCPNPARKSEVHASQRVCIYIYKV